MSDEHQLADRLARGDESAFEALARALERSLYSHACRLLRDETQAEDAVQDALLLAYRGRATFRGGSFKAWVFRILTNRCLDLIREAKRRPAVPLDPPAGEEGEDAAMQWADPAPEIETIVIGNELFALVEEALSAVPAEQRAAVMLRDVQGFDYEEIARITNSELGTVKSRIHRGRLAVRNYLVARGWHAGNPPGPGGVQAST
jgi:RNA polymerase sigma-70 factor (ECF subfamily)